MQPLKNKSLFWHHIWLECDRPKTGAVADTLRQTRDASYYAIRKIKQDEDASVRERIADSMLTNKDQNFWSETKRIRNNQIGASNSIMVLGYRYCD